MQDRINLGEVRERGVLFYTREAAAILEELCSRLSEAEDEGRLLEPPTLDRMWVTADGDLLIDAGPANPASDPMPPLAALIETVLPPPLRDHADYAVPGSFRILAPRARGWPPGLPPIGTPDELATAVSRYRRGEGTTSILQGLFTRTAGGPADPAPAIVSPSLGLAVDLRKDVSSSEFPFGTRPEGSSAETVADPILEAEQWPIQPPDVPAMSADGEDDLWLNAAEEDEGNDSPSTSPIGGLPPPLRSAASRALSRSRYARNGLFTVALMLLAFVASYQVTRRLASHSERTVRAADGPASETVVAGKNSPGAGALHAPEPLDIPSQSVRCSLRRLPRLGLCSSSMQAAIRPRVS